MVVFARGFLVLVVDMVESVVRGVLMTILILCLIILSIVLISTGAFVRDVLFKGLTGIEPPV